jgi:hypothetical protein
MRKRIKEHFTCRQVFIGISPFGQTTSFSAHVCLSCGTTAWEVISGLLFSVLPLVILESKNRRIRALEVLLQTLASQKSVSGSINFLPVVGCL